MLILALHISSEKGNIIIHSSEINIDAPTSKRVTDYDQTIYSLLEDMDPYKKYNTAKMSKVFKRKAGHVEPITFEATYTSDNPFIKTKLSCTVNGYSYYTLPPHPIHALNLLDAYHTFFLKKNFDRIVFIEKPLEPFFNALRENKQPILSLNKLTGIEDVLFSDSIQKMAVHIIKCLPSLPLYKTTLEAITLRFLMRLHFNTNFYDLINYLIKINNPALLKHLIADFNRAAKEKIFEPALGKLSHMNIDPAKCGTTIHTYDWSYTEWDLLRSAVFRIRADGKVGIVLKDNEGYKRYYAPGKVNEAIFQNEFEYLLPILGLKFDPATNFHEELIFDTPSSAKLIHQGVHLNELYLKEWIRNKNKAALLSAGKKNPSSSLYSVPYEVLNLINDCIKPPPSPVGYKMHLTLNDTKLAHQIGWGKSKDPERVLKSPFSFFVPKKVLKTQGTNSTSCMIL